MSNRISKRILEAYIINLRSFAMDDCVEAHKKPFHTQEDYFNLCTSAKVKREIAEELEKILCGVN